VDLKTGTNCMLPARNSLHWQRHGQPERKIILRNIPNKLNPKASRGRCKHIWQRICDTKIRSDKESQLKLIKGKSIKKI
jgi:hypothetical protein